MRLQSIELVDCIDRHSGVLGIPPPPYILRKVFKVDTLGPDLDWTLVKKSCFQRTSCAKYSKDGTWRAWLGPGGSFCDAGFGVAPCVYYMGRVKGLAPDVGVGLE